MGYSSTNLATSPKQIVKQIIESDSSQLLIPPQYSSKEVDIEKLNSSEKSIGLFSSGTTSNPTCIWNSFDNLILNAKLTALAFDIKSKDRILMLAKPWHVAGLSWMLMAENLGCEYEFITTEKGESDKWFEAIQSFKPDYLLTVPPVFRDFYNRKWFIKKIISGGIPLAQNDFEPLRNHCEMIYQGYGQTEAGGLISVMKHDISNEVDENLHQNCGRPIKGVTLETKGSEKEPSDIYIKSETAFTEKLYNSRDLGLMKNGQIYLTGRKEEITSLKD